jgi:hypothetical protein
MKKLLVTTFCSILLLSVKAQSFHSAQSISETKEIKSSKRPNAFLGIGTGLNSYCGFLGGIATVHAYKNLSAKAGVGLGSWGVKTALGLKLDFDSTGNWGVGIGYEFSPGVNGVKSNLQLEDKTTKEVTFNTQNASSINISFTKTWYLGRENKYCMFLDLGYGFAMEKNPWTITDHSKISEASKFGLRLSQPGGLILATGFLFGL